MHINFWAKIWTLSQLSKKFNKKSLHEKMNDVYQTVKPEAHFKDNTKVKEQTGRNF